MWSVMQQDSRVEVILKVQAPESGKILSYRNQLSIII